MSDYGHWATQNGLPTFVYSADQRILPQAEWNPMSAAPTRRHWLMLGNRRIQLFVANDGGLGLFDESYGLRWLTAPDVEGTGFSIVEEEGQYRWGSSIDLWPAGDAPVRTFGPTFFSLQAHQNGLSLERTVQCPEGESPWVLVRVRLQAIDSPRAFTHIEQWTLRPQFINLGGTRETRRELAKSIVSFTTEITKGKVRAQEVRTGNASEITRDAPPAGELGNVGVGFRQIFGPEIALQLEQLGVGIGQAQVAGSVEEPLLEIHTEVTLAAGETRDLWFRFCVDDGTTVDDPGALFDASLHSLADRLPHAETPHALQAAHEVPWHAALLTGGACRDELIGGHTLDQASAYSYVLGFNGAARDPLQHALPLVYCEPELALSVLRNTCAWADPNGDLPYALDGAKQPWTTLFQASDQNLYALWLAAEYAAATGNLDTFDAPLAYHPQYGAEAVPLREHLRRQFRFFVDGVGFGAHGHVRMRNADWNDMAVVDAGVERSIMTTEGESVLNSAFAAWVLPVFAGLCARLGETAMEAEARQVAEKLRRVVAEAWNGRWFDRAYAPGGRVVGGPDDMWLEVQPWALLCDAADEARAHELLATLETGARANSPLGARVRWPVPSYSTDMGEPGEGTGGGGIWYAINMTLIWAASRYDKVLGWDEWRRMSLAAHTEAYPSVWEGTLSGPDAFNAPESPRPGRTWMNAQFDGMQSFPVNNLHSHAQPLIAYLRLLGVEPTPRGTLRIGSGARWQSPTFRLEEDGHGELVAQGPVVLETIYGEVRGGPGIVTW